MKPLLKDQQHRNLTFWGMAMIVIGLPLSVFLVSVGTFLLVGNWLLEGEHLKRLKQFFTDRLSLSIIALYLFCIVGLLWTEDLAYGWRELRIKVPLLVLPLVLFTSKFPSKQRIQDLLLLFVFSCCVGMLFGMAHYFEMTGDELLNKRSISVFISHIRFGLMLVLAFFILAYFLLNKWLRWSLTEKLICILVMVWILWFLLILEAFTAYVAFAVLLVYSGLRAIQRRSNRRLGYRIIALSVLLLIAGSLYVKSIVDVHYKHVAITQKTLKWRTNNGNYYIHQKETPFQENGHRVWNFVCWEELESEWPKRSSLNLDSVDLRGQKLKFTLIRYMSSMGLAKDSADFSRLSDADIKNIEKGLTNHLYTGKLGISRRINDLLRAVDKYRYEQTANSSSSFQRLIYAKVGLQIFKQNPVIGVGTGDLVSAYKSEFERNPRGLEKEYQNISHNQFLSIAVTHGLIGFLLLLILLLYPAWSYKADFLYVCFILLMIVSFLTDNTLDRQSGVTLFAFFNCLLIIRNEIESSG
jgi:hypothetical protein